MSAPLDPREDRYRPLSMFLTGAVVAVASLGLLALVLGGGWAEAAAAAMVVMLIATPLLRIVWLVGRWFSRGDYRYAMVGIVVLLIPVAGFALSR